MDWREQYKQVLEAFLHYMNEKTDKYVLKGGTALAQCYNLNRFSEGIDLDGKGNLIMELCQTFSTQNGYECRIAKNIDTVKRCMIHYGGIKPLKVEASARRKNIPFDEVTNINGIQVYTIDTMTILKTFAYQQRDKIRDLFDVTFIINNYYDVLSPIAQLSLQNALEYKGLEYFDYIINNQQDELIDINVLAENFLNAYDKLGLLVDANLKNEILNFHNSIKNDSKNIMDESLPIKARKVENNDEWEI